MRLRLAVLLLAAVGFAGCRDGSNVSSVDKTGVRVSAGGVNPADSVEPAGLEDLPLLQISMATETDVVQLLRTLTVTLHGSRDLVRSLTLLVDKDADGSVSPIDTRIVQVFGPFSSATVPLAGLSHTLPYGNSTFIIAAALDPAGSPGTSVLASLDGAASVKAQTDEDKDVVTTLVSPNGVVAGGLKTLGEVKTLLVAPGGHNPGPSSVSPAGIDLPALQFDVSMPSGSADGAELNEVVLVGAGSADDSSAVTRVRLYRDTNSNGILDIPGDALLGTGAMTSDNGEVVFGGLTQAVPSGALVSLLAVMDLSGNGATGQTVGVGLKTNGVSAKGLRSRRALSVAGTPLSAPTLTLNPGGGLTLSSGPANPGDSTEGVAATGVAMLQLSLNASTGQSVRVTQLTLRASGTGNDQTGLPAVRLYLDQDGNGLFDGTDSLLGTASVTTNDGVATFSGLSAVIPGGTTQTWLVQADLSGTVLPAETFRLSVQDNAAVTAVDPASAAALSVNGAPVNGALKTIASQGSLVISAGVNTPGASNESAAASGVAMLQFALTASSVEGVRVNSVSVRASGTANDATTVGAVHLYRDVNGNGLYEVGTDLALGSGGTYAADNGTVTFGGLTEDIAASARNNYLVTYDLNGSASPSQTFAASIALGSAVAASGLSSAATITPTGNAAGATKTVLARGSLVVAAGVNNPGASQQNANAAAVPMLQFSLTAGSVENVLVTTVTFRAAGTGNDVTGISAVELYRDQNDDGTLDIGDTAVGGTLTYAADNGTVSFTGLSQTVPAGERVNYLVLYDFSAAALPGQTFSASVSTGTSVTAVGVASSSAIVPTGAAAGALATVRTASLAVTADSQNPTASSEFSNATNLPVLQVRVTAGSGDAVRITKIIATAGGTANDVADLLNVALYRDADESGTLTLGDVQLGAAATATQDNGSIQFTGLNEVIAASSAESLLFVYNLAGTAVAAQTFDLRLLNNGAITAVGVSSGAAAIVSGAPVTGGVKTVKGASLTVATGLSNPGATTQLPMATGVSMLQLRLTAGATDSVRLTSVTFNAIGSLDDSTGISAVRLYRDTDANGLATGADVLLAGPATYASENGSLTFSGLSETIAASANVHWLVVYDLSGMGTAGQTLDVRTLSAASFSAESQTTGQPAAITGGTTQSAAVTLRATTLAVALGLSTPASSSEAPNATGLPVLQVRLTADAGDSVLVNGLSVTPSGTMNDATGVAEVRLYLDADADGMVSGGDFLLGSPRSFVANDVATLFSSLGLVVAAGTSEHLLVVYDLSGTPASGDAFELRVAAAGSVQAFSLSSGQAAAVTGAPVTGFTKNVVTQFNSWTPMSRTGAPTARANHTAVVNGNELVVFGGENSSGVLAGGGVFNVSTNSWTPLSATGAPSARAGHLAAIAGGYMVVFGGRSGSGYLADGARYELATGTWSPMSTTNAPSMRSYSTIVSNGTVVMVWGGYGGSALGTGAVYDPALNLWTPMTGTGAPSARYLHTAVWTGTQMVVWGGYNGSYLTDGARYNPATDTWTAMLSGATVMGVSGVGLSLHSAVWTGAEMFVWGGYRGNVYSLVGGAYDPVANTWRTLASSGVPTARGQHAAVYTGSKMMVWGGYSGTAPLDTGGLLDPVFNQWTPSSQSSAPVPRYNFTGVWMGGKLVVWGGQNASSFLDSGGMYVP